MCYCITIVLPPGGYPVPSKAASHLVRVLCHCHCLLSRASPSQALLDSEPLSAEETEVGSEEGVGQEQVLWVDKYSPSHFTELLSDDVSAQFVYH